MTDLRTAAQQALDYWQQVAWGDAVMVDKMDALSTALAQEQAEPDAYGYASRLAVAIWEKHYKGVAPNWKPLNDLMGVLTQIDNMTAGLTRQEQPNSPGCEHCNHPLYAATKCRVCGRVTDGDNT